MNYLANDWSFVLPDAGFEDKTVHLFEARLADGAVAGLAVSRRPLAAGKTLRKTVDEHTLQQAKLFEGFSVVVVETQRSGVFAIVAKLEGENFVFLRAPLTRFDERHDSPVFHKKRNAGHLSTKLPKLCVIAKKPGCDSRILFIPQSNHGIDTRGAVGGNEAGDNAEEEGEARYRGESGRVGCGDAPDLTGEETRQEITGE